MTYDSEAVETIYLSIYLSQERDKKLFNEW